jgi:hypothetical protein
MVGFHQQRTPLIGRLGMDTSFPFDAERLIQLYGKHAGYV